MRHAHWLGFLIFPAALTALLAGPPMVGPAEGCSGAGPDYSPGWRLLPWPGDLAAPTDAVVVFAGTVRELSDTDALEAFSIEVTDASNAAVSGKKSLETLEHESPPGQRHVAVIWKPDAPLAPASTYTVSWSIASGAVALSRGTISGEGTLKTNGAPSSSPGPTGAATFARYRKLVGDLVSCQIGGTCFPETTFWFGTTEIELPALDLSIAHPSASTSAYQLTRIQAVPGKGALHKEPPAALRAASYESASTREVLFSDDLPEYCVQLVTRDLRNDAITISPEICAPASSVSAIGSTLSERLEHCEEPPSDALKDEWCALHPTADQCQSTAGTGGVGTGGTTGSGASASGLADDRDSGCSMPVSRRHPPLGALAIALLVLGARLLSSRGRWASRAGSASSRSP
jgi:hypothetical protein